MQWTTPFEGCDIPVQVDDGDSETVVVVAHGAGSHMDQKTVVRLSQIVRDTGATVARFNFLYRVRGNSMPDRMPVLISTYRAVIESIRERGQPKRLIVGGHSMGGRAASMLEAEAPTADGLLLFGYPLHPAGKPDRLRDAHLPRIQTPTLQINGTEDLLCSKEIMDRVASGLDSKIWNLHWVEGADHSYAVKKSTGRTHADVETEIREAVRGWLGGIC